MMENLIRWMTSASPKKGQPPLPGDFKYDGELDNVDDLGKSLKRSTTFARDFKYDGELDKVDDLGKVALN